MTPGPPDRPGPGAAAQAGTDTGPDPAADTDTATASRTGVRDARAGLVTAVAVAVLGVPVGLAWGRLAPREDVRLAPDGAVSFVNAGGDLFVGGDLVYVLLACLAGTVAGALAHLRGHARGWPVVVGLVIGGALAALVAVRLGEWLGTGPLVYERGQLAPADGLPLPPGSAGVVEVALRLRAESALVLLPLSAVLAHLSLQLVRPEPTDRPPGHEPVRDEPAGPGVTARRTG